MKQIIAVFTLGLLCAGCAIDTGVHRVALDLGRVKFDKEADELTPSFRVAAKKPEIADQGRGALLGKWRVVINTDEVTQYSANGEWEIRMYEFNEDRTYSMRRLAKDKKTILKSAYGEDGQWTYADGALRLHPEGYSEWWVKLWRPQYEFRVKWHSSSSFTLEYANVDAIKTAWDNYFKEHYPKTTYSQGIHYDERGCLQQHRFTYNPDSIAKIWDVRSVTSPWLFVKID